MSNFLDGDAPILPCSNKNEVSTNAPGLSELSHQDKPWDKHRHSADRVANHYRGDGEFDRYAQRMDFCSQLLEFKLVPHDRDSSLRFKLSGARFCRVRHCPVCQWRRSLKWKAKA
ncbi:MAG: protein rep, partial [Cyanobacteria bacterium P01_C01_bin.72]